MIGAFFAEMFPRGALPRLARLQPGPGARRRAGADPGPRSLPGRLHCVRGCGLPDRAGFATGAVLCDDCTEVPVGAITMGTGHAPCFVAWATHRRDPRPQASGVRAACGRAATSARYSCSAVGRVSHGPPTNTRHDRGSTGLPAACRVGFALKAHGAKPTADRCLRRRPIGPWLSTADLTVNDRYAIAFRDARTRPPLTASLHGRAGIAIRRQGTARRPCGNGPSGPPSPDGLASSPRLRSPACRPVGAGRSP